MDFLKLALVFVLIILALRLKVSVGLTLLLAGLLVAVLFQMPFNELTDRYRQLVGSRRFISLTAVIVSITMLGAVLKGIGSLEKLGRACRNLYGGRQTAAAVMPPLIGLMPMPGGALLSAPLVDSVLSEGNNPSALKCAANYWFRHVVEHFMPIYPGLIVSEAITGVPVSRLALMQSPLAIVMLSLGLVFLIRRINGGRDSRGQLFRPVLGILVTVWPIILAIFLYGWFGMDLSLAVITALLSVLVVYRPSWKIVGQSLRKGLSYKLLILILGILSFQTVLEGSGAIASLQQLSLEYHLPDKLIIVLVCFVSGILTGMFAAFVALGYSLLGTFLYQPHPVPANILLAFLSGYLGMMLSPAHLCLVLTNEYFGSSLGQVYRRLVVPVLLLGLAGYLLVISGWPEWVMTVVE